MTDSAPPPTVSAVIPVHNGQAYVAEAIESVLAQSHPPIECLVIDDGSTDGTRDAVAAFGDAVRYVHQPQRGVSSARNRGTEMAHGGLVAFLDHDDIWLADKLARQIEAIQAGRATMAGSDLVSGMVLFDGTEIVSCSSTGLVRRRELLAMGGFDPELAMSADWDLLLRVLLEGGLEYVDEPLVLYRVHDSNMSRHVSAMERDMNHAFAKAFANPKLPMALLRRRGLAYSRLYRMLSGSYRDNDQHLQALRTLAVALRYQPGLALELLHRPPRWRHAG